MFNRTRTLFYRARGHYGGQLNGERFRFDPAHRKFWRRASRGKWEPETFAVLDRYLSSDADYLDIGAWIGPTVLYGARKARRVICLEPDPVAFRHLAWNLDLNGITNVTALSAALARETGIARMTSFGGKRGDSMTSLLNTDGPGGSDVLTLGWEKFAASADLSRVALVKVDVEGAEFDLLPLMVPWLQASRPALYLSTHAPYLPPEQRDGRMADLFERLSFYGSVTQSDGQTAAQAPDLGRFETFLFAG